METHQLQCTLVFDLMVSAAKSVSCGKQITKHYVSDTVSDSCYRMVLDLQSLHVHSVPITTNVVSSNPAHGEVYSMQPYVIKFVSELRQVGGFLWVLRFSPQIKLTATI